jgi:hypothetical protein
MRIAFKIAFKKTILVLAFHLKKYSKLKKTLSSMRK